MGLWSEQVVPRLAAVVLRGAEVGALRADVCRGLHGRVLEIGFGSGLNVPWYPVEVDEVAAVEPSDVGWRLSAGRRAEADLPIRRHGLDGQRLDEPDAAYDAVLSTFTRAPSPTPRWRWRRYAACSGPADGCTCWSTGSPPTPLWRADSSGWSRCNDASRAAVTSPGT